jgi:hypothetical protein
MNEASIARRRDHFVTLEVTLTARPLTVDSAVFPSRSAGPFQGLCVNCDRRFDCTYPKPAGGVRSCDEYA